MLSSRLSERMKTRVDPDKCCAVEKYIKSLSYSTIITADRASRKLSLDESTAKDILRTLVDMEVLQRGFAVRCPECGLLAESADNIDDIKESVFCYGCDEDVEIDRTDVEEIFFVLRNSNDVAEEFPDSYSLLTVEKESEYGVSQGRLLHIADSIDELNNFAEANRYDDKLLHYVTGDNLL